MTQMSINSAVPLLFVMTSFAICSGDEADWDYPRSGPGGVSEERAGKAGRFRTYYCISEDSPEKVALWYAVRIGLPDDHRLVVAARNGFSSLENNQIIKTGHGHDTDDRQDHTTMIALLSARHSHISFLHRRSFKANQDLSISIASLPDGKTSITVIEPVVDAN